MSKQSFDLSLYLIISQSACMGRDIFQVLRAALKGGVTMIQLREKDLPTRDFLHLARALKKELHSHGVPLIINDRVDVAIAAGVDGVHVGQEDMHPEDVRDLIGPNAILGLSANTSEDVYEAKGLAVDYLGLGPVFATQSKADCKPVLGLEGFSALRQETTLPLVGIGGITDQNAGQVIAAGAEGVSLISAICRATSPDLAAKSIRERIDRARHGGMTE